MNSDPDTNPKVVVQDEAIGAGTLGMRQIRPIGSREFASTLLTNVVIQGCTLVQGILVARLLGPVGRGNSPRPFSGRTYLRAWVEWGLAWRSLAELAALSILPKLSALAYCSRC